jgi:hypothetical protein
MQVLINGEASIIFHLDELRNCFTTISQEQYAEMSLEGTSNSSLLMLNNKEQARALLMFVRNHDGDPGFSSRDPQIPESSDTFVEFRLSNGQLDRFLLSWTLPISEAWKVCEYFFTTNGRMAPWIMWHDDS